MILDTVRRFPEGYRTAAAAFRPLPAMLVSQWADAYRVLPIAEAEPGPWRTDRMPPSREIMDVLSPMDPTEEVVFMKSAQVSGTEIGNNWLGCVMHLEPGRILQVQPSLETAKRHSKSRIAPLIDETPVLRKLVKPARSRDSGNTILAKEFPGGLFALTGANSAKGLRSTPCRYVMLDEIDAFPEDVENEGNPIDLAVERTRTFRSKRKIYKPSTPTIKGLSNIEKAYEKSDRRRYFVPCPYCGVEQVMVWSKEYAGDMPNDVVVGQIVWPPNQPEEAQYECGNPSCMALWSEGQKMGIIARGRWIAERVRAPGMAAGFFLNALYSPWISWAEMAIEFLQAKDDPVALKSFVNLKLAQPWEDKGLGSNIGLSSLTARCEVYEADVPSEVLVITAGIDTQDDRLEVEVVGWGKKEEAWSLGHIVLWGDPSGAEVWLTLDDLLLTPLYDTQDRPHYIQASCLDTAGHHTLSCYDFVRPRVRRRVWGIKGRDGKWPIWPKKPSKNNKGKIELWHIGVDAAKERLYSRLKYPPPGAGRMHFQVGCDEEYFKQLTSEVRVTQRVRGREKTTWQLKYSANEVLDTWVYAYAALYGLIAHGMRWEPLHRPPGRAKPRAKPKDDTAGMLEVSTSDEELDTPSASPNASSGDAAVRSAPASMVSLPVQVRRRRVSRSHYVGR